MRRPMNNYRMKLLSVPYSNYAIKAGSASPVLEVMTEAQRMAMPDPEPGLMILNSTTNMINVYRPDGWSELGGEPISGEFSCGKMLIDSRDQEQYKTVKIGDQCWMAENLNAGEMIVGSIEMSDNLVIEKYCYNDSITNCEIYGGLYQWNELMKYTTSDLG